MPLPIEDSGDDGRIRIGANVGGANIDVLLIDGTDEYVDKTSTADDPSESTTAGIVKIYDRDEVDPSAVNQVLRGTTVATNAIIEYEGTRRVC